MAILIECPSCRNKQAAKNKVCKCGADLDKAKRSKKVRYWISFRIPIGQDDEGKTIYKQRREFVGKSIEKARMLTASAGFKKGKTGFLICCRNPT